MSFANGLRLARAAGSLLALAGAGAARADGSATTLLDSRPYVRDGGHQETPLYESFALSARSDGGDVLQDVRIVARAWGRLTLGTPFDEHRTAGDVDSLFVEGRVLKRHLLLRVGRQLAVGGAVRATQLDGIAADGVVRNGIGAQAWAGVPVQPRFSQAGGDFLTGARVFWRHAFDSEVGASFVYALRKGYIARRDVALEGSWTPIRAVTVNALGQWSLEEARLAEARLQGLWQASPKLQLVADVQRTAPDLFLDRTSIFSVFSEERRDEAGGEVVYRLLQPLSLEGDWHFLKVEGGNGHRGGARATFRTPTGGSFGAEARLLTEPDNGYKLARLFGIRRFPRNVTVTLDLDAYWLERQINAEKRSFVATLTGGWAFLPGWEAMLAGSFGTTPYFERRTEVIARVAWRFGVPARLPGGFR
ncbi:MAG: hypothetical protein E6J61_04805 [Deltaproteobacteria bacterium]|nr:MAG: hypothetical protein E6J61_04805 [Deltaproteobacteria bacterium]